MEDGHYAIGSIEEGCIESDIPMAKCGFAWGLAAVDPCPQRHEEDS
jgi:hypothetical protein